MTVTVIIRGSQALFVARSCSPWNSGSGATPGSPYVVRGASQGFEKGLRCFKFPKKSTMSRNLETKEFPYLGGISLPTGLLGRKKNLLSRGAAMSLFVLTQVLLDLTCTTNHECCSVRQNRVELQIASNWNCWIFWQAFLAGFVISCFALVRAW